MERADRRLIAFGLIAASMALAACSQVIGLQDRQLDPEYGASADATAEGTTGTVETGADATGDDGSPSTDGALFDGGGGADTGDAGTGGDAGNCHCVPQPPSGGGVPWRGPVMLVESAGALAPACPAGAGFPTSSFAGNGGLSAPAAECACRCTPTGVTCKTDVSIWGSGSNCTNMEVLANASAGVCVQLPNNGGRHDILTSGVVIDAGTCTPSGQTNLPDASWGTSATTCAASSSLVQGACPSNDLCAPPPASGPPPKLCIVTSGAIACPQAGYTVQHIYYTGTTDTRGCACTCGPVTNYVCGEKLLLANYNDYACGSDQWNAAPPTTCQVNGAGTSPSSALLSGPDGGACAPDVSPTGTVTPAQPTTVCCQP
jgi:hypothetical protein